MRVCALCSLCVSRAGLGSGLFSLRRSFSSLPALCGRKKSSEYSSVDSEHYSSLVRAVVSTRTSSQTPESIESEDARLFGAVVRSKPKQAPKTLKNPSPLLNEAKSSVRSEYEAEAMTRIALRRNPDQPTLPSVTKILQKTMSATQLFYLERWKRRKIAELGEEGFKEYRLKEDVECPEDVAGYLQSIGHVLEDVTGVRAIESVVEHESLKYLGIMDCVAMYRGSLCVIDWKTSEKPKPFIHNTYDNPLQVAAYIGALNSDNNYNYQVENGLIVVAYKDGSPAHSHCLNAEQVTQYWEKWLFRLEEYKEKDA
ncbi:mitochondrial genome maintenance exonuclease 1 isoform X2 [Pygocentrus nattereri]|uniref:mitochondrial genome maintenance exonuclease 1 isoform X2 n=1 Tax=Pygocentrus nattereri TaxID=42514 RepID=UPI001891A466|nr:mitochondrial genome maintenance exonuclease 1 isoform X2 [Pygocentrus nattereri]